MSVLSVTCGMRWRKSKAAGAAPVRGSWSSRSRSPAAAEAARAAAAAAVSACCAAADLWRYLQTER